MENIAIKEGGLARLIGPVERLKTDLKAGGSCLWIPQSKVPMTTKSIIKNGTYNAADENVYGYSQVTVNVTDADSITGKDQDGNEHVVTKGSGGELNDIKVPSSLVITRLPLSLMYRVGEPLSFEGIEVTAYYNDGSVYGVIPYDKLGFPVTTAPFDASQATRWVTSDIDTSPIIQPIPTATSITGYAKYLAKGGIVEYECMCSASTSSAVLWFMGTEGVTTMPALQIVSENPSAVVTCRRTRTGYHDNDNFGTMQTGTTPVIINDKAFYWLSSQSGSLFNIGPYDSKDTIIVQPTFSLSFASRDSSGETNLNNARYSILYGDVAYEGGFQVPVTWNRPGDNVLLQTSYGITVASGML